MSLAYALWMLVYYMLQLIQRHFCNIHYCNNFLLIFVFWYCINFFFFVAMMFLLLLYFLYLNTYIFSYFIELAKTIIVICFSSCWSFAFFPWELELYMFTYFNFDFYLKHHPFFIQILLCKIYIVCYSLISLIMWLLLWRLVIFLSMLCFVTTISCTYA